MTKRRCDFCIERARYVYEGGGPGVGMCYWHVLIFYIGIDGEWHG